MLLWGDVCIPPRKPLSRYAIRAIVGIYIQLQFLAGKVQQSQVAMLCFYIELNKFQNISSIYFIKRRREREQMH